VKLNVSEWDVLAGEKRCSEVSERYRSVTDWNTAVPTVRPGPASVVEPSSVTGDYRTAASTGQLRPLDGRR